MTTLVQRVAAVVAVGLLTVGLTLVSQQVKSVGSLIAAADQERLAGADQNHGSAPNNCRSVNNLSATCTGNGTQCLRCDGPFFEDPFQVSVISSSEGGWQSSGDPVDCGEKQIGTCVVAPGQTVGTCSGATVQVLGDCDDVDVAVEQTGDPL